jgi:hypothetical protein
MPRNVLITLGAAALLWAVLAIVLGSASLTLGTGAGSHSAHSPTSPACLPSTLSHSAALAGTAVDVSPAPGSETANAATQISFLGVPAAEVKDISVKGSDSGSHSGRLRSYSQGDGASFAPDHPFQAGERVEVRASVGRPAKAASFSFHVDTPYPTGDIAQFPNPPAPAPDVQSFYTLPGAQVPSLTVTVPDRDPAAGDILMTNGPGPGQYGPLIYTPQGRLVWFDRLTGGETAENLNAQRFQGRRDLTWWKGRVLSLGFGEGEDVVMDSAYRTVARVTGGNGLEADLHDFQIQPHDVAFITAYNPIRCNLTAVSGLASGAILDTAIQMIDMKTGLVRWEWHSVDHVGAGESEVETPSDSAPWDYFHLNSIDPQPDGRILISARSTWAGYELQAGSGNILWRLGGNRSSFRMGPGTKMAWQHDGRMSANGEVTFFDDGANPPVHRQSRAVRIALDLKTHRARLVSELTHGEPPLLAASQGNAQTLSDGNTLVGYGGVPAISEFAPDGSLVFDAHTPFDMSFYRAFRSPWSARPATPPTVLASLNNTGEETVAHASWNGATGVASWRVLAGEHPATLSAQATIRAVGFEDSATLPRKHAFVAAQALDSSGRVLATSPAVKVLSYAAGLTSASTR